MKITFLSISFVLVSCITFSQNMNLNRGLAKPQDAATLPRSVSKVIFPVKKAKIPPAPILSEGIDNEWIISDGWEMTDETSIKEDGKKISSQYCNTMNWYNAVVPGTVLTTLVEQGIYPDPFYGLNNLAIPDSLCYKSWWYRTKLPLRHDMKGKNIELLFNGINYRAEVWLNGSILGRIDGAFIRGKFDITSLINYNSDNFLAVRIYPPDHPGVSHEASPSAGNGENGGIMCYDGPTFIASEGWDWIPGIRDRNIGIWQDVRIIATSGIRITDPFIISNLPLPDTTIAALTIETGLENLDDYARTFILAGQIESAQFSKKITIGPHEAKKVVLSHEEFIQLNITNPRLWWPNGYGSPELYYLTLYAINEEGDTSDYKRIRFGIRELSYDLSVNYRNRKNVRVEFNPVFALLKNHKPLFDNLPLKADIESLTLPRMRDQSDTVLLFKGESIACAPYLVVRVNGQKIFCKGGNWGMDDGMKRCSRERLEPYFRLHRDENFTMVRNWTGESTEEVFYELCDEYGLLVWNEFWATTQYYNVDPWDNQLFINNVRDVVRRFRNHPSIAIWGARNEGFPTIALEDSIRWVLAQEDPTRHYSPQSRYLNLKRSGPWNYFENQTDYYTKEAYGFSTEFGTVSLPTSETLRKFIPEEDLWPWRNDVWYYHDFNFGGWINVDGYAKTVETRYGNGADNLDEFCKRAQLVNYDSYRNIFEAYNSNLWKNTCGILLWMSHPAWPSTLWQTYSYDYETHGSYFGSMKACEPVHIQLNLDDNKVVVVNTSLKPINNTTASFQIISTDNKILYTKETVLSIPANVLTHCFTPDFPGNLPPVYLARLCLKSETGKVLSLNDYWRNSENGRDLSPLANLKQVSLSGRIGGISDDKEIITLRIKNNSSIVAVGIKLNLRNARTDEIILPCYFSDGYFNLLPGEVKEIIMELPVRNLPEELAVSAVGMNILKKTLFKFPKKNLI